MKTINTGGSFGTPGTNNISSLSGLKRPTKQYQVNPTYLHLTSPENLKWNEARSQVLGAAWKLLEATASDRPKVFELRSPWWTIDTDGAEAMCQKQMMRYLAQDIDACGGDKTPGYFMSFLNTEYNDNEERFAWFVRGIACGEMLSVLDSQRYEERFWSYEGHRPGVWVADRPVTDIPSTVQWLFEPHYSEVYYGPMGNDGRLLGENLNSPCYKFKDLLAFSDAYEIDDICIFRNLRVSDDCTSLEVVR